MCFNARPIATKPHVDFPRQRTHYINHCYFRFKIVFFLREPLLLNILNLEIVTKYKNTLKLLPWILSQASNSPKCVESIDKGVSKQAINGLVEFCWLWGLWKTGTRMDPLTTKTRRSYDKCIGNIAFNISHWKIWSPFHKRYFQMHFCEWKLS